MTMVFENPQNSYTEQVDKAWLWCLLFGTFYFIYKGVWVHAAISFGMALMTSGLSWLIYPFFADKAIRKAYLQKGWKEVNGNEVRND